ncbi:hypothetical protein NQ318_014390 [Aromia moschata]|uniref:MYND-type domain-containing protein n=1 Tax=Aromia moschata TaxID=1265417 RepID=A0AAV8XMQ7_9CUCU|nr:hypothetical protein NQ318_014390 [Aromia moschata]
MMHGFGDLRGVRVYLIISQNQKMVIKKQPLSPGDIILQEKPFVYVLSSRSRTERCDFCFKKADLLKCSVCRYVYYCGRGCQREGWSIHKIECQHLKRISPRILPDARKAASEAHKNTRERGELHQIILYREGLQDL